METRAAYKVSYNNIVPDDVAQVLMIIRDRDKLDRFTIGDIAEQLIQAASSREPFTRSMIYSAIGSIVGKAARSVREYHQIAQAFNKTERETYAVLAFDHFRYAVRMGEQCFDALDWAVAQGDAMTRPATVDAMLAKFANDGGDEPQQEAEAVQYARGAAMRTLTRLVIGLKEMLGSGRIGLSVGTRQALYDALAAVEREVGIAEVV